MEIIADSFKNFVFGGGIFLFILIYGVVITTEDNGSYTGRAFTKMQALTFSALIFIIIYVLYSIISFVFGGGSACSGARWSGYC